MHIRYESRTKSIQGIGGGELTKGVRWVQKCMNLEFSQHIVYFYEDDLHSSIHNKHILVHGRYLNIHMSPRQKSDGR